MDEDKNPFYIPIIALTALAQTLKCYYDNLLVAGFNEEQALKLVIEMQSNCFKNPNKEGENGNE